VNAIEEGFISDPPRSEKEAVENMAWGDNFPPIVRREKSCVPLLVATRPQTAFMFLVFSHISYLFLKIHP